MSINDFWLNVSSIVSNTLYAVSVIINVFFKVLSELKYLFLVIDKIEFEISNKFAYSSFG